MKITLPTEKGPRKVDAEVAFVKFGFTFVHHPYITTDGAVEPSLFSISELTTGMSLAHGKTLENAEAQAMMKLSRFGEAAVKQSVEGGAKINASATTE